MKNLLKDPMFKDFDIIEQIQRHRKHTSTLIAAAHSLSAAIKRGFQVDIAGRTLLCHYYDAKKNQPDRKIEYPKIKKPEKEIVKVKITPKADREAWLKLNQLKLAHTLRDFFKKLDTLGIIYTKQSLFETIAATYSINDTAVASAYYGYQNEIDPDEYPQATMGEPDQPECDPIEQLNLASLEGELRETKQDLVKISTDLRDSRKTNELLKNEIKNLRSKIEQISVPEPKKTLFQRIKSIFSKKK